MTAPELPSPGGGQTSSWLSAPRAAALLRVCPGTLRRWAAEGAVPVLRTPGGRMWFTRADITAAAGSDFAARARRRARARRGGGRSDEAALPPPWQHRP